MNFGSMSDETRRRILARGLPRRDSQSSTRTPPPKRASDSLLQYESSLHRHNCENEYESLSSLGSFKTSDNSIQRRRKEPLSPLTLNGNLSQDDRDSSTKSAFHFSTPKAMKETTTYTSGKLINRETQKIKSPVTIAKKAAQIRKQKQSNFQKDRPLKTPPRPLQNKQFGNTETEKGKCVLSSIPKLSPAMLKMISKYGTTLQSESLPSLGNDCSIHEVANLIAQINENDTVLKDEENFERNKSTQLRDSRSERLKGNKVKAAPKHRASANDLDIVNSTDIYRGYSQEPYAQRNTKLPLRPPKIQSNAYKTGTKPSIDEGTKQKMAQQKYERLGMSPQRKPGTYSHVHAQLSPAPRRSSANDGEVVEQKGVGQNKYARARELVRARRGSLGSFHLNGSDDEESTLRSFRNNSPVRVTNVNPTPAKNRNDNTSKVGAVDTVIMKDALSSQLLPPMKERHLSTYGSIRSRTASRQSMSEKKIESEENESFTLRQMRGRSSDLRRSFTEEKPETIKHQESIPSRRQRKDPSQKRRSISLPRTIQKGLGEKEIVYQSSNYLQASNSFSSHEDSSALQLRRQKAREILARRRGSSGLNR